jgi:hypothetical protein
MHLRVIALIMSITTLVPITMTLVKFLLTKNTTFVVDGKERTAWAADTITWYTYMYFGVSLISATFNLAIVIAYCRGVKKANNVADVASWWGYIVLLGHVAVCGKVPRPLGVVSAIHSEHEFYGLI